MTARFLFVLILAASAALLPAVLTPPAPVQAPAAAAAPLRADFGATEASADARNVADWIAASDDAGGGEFILVDKKNAVVHVFDGAARLRASSAVLLGAASGDDPVPGIGTRPIAEVRPEERTTPAGRFLAERGHNARGEDVVWVDYDNAVSMHRVLTTNRRERRLERLATPTADDNRISYGCINVPVDFFEAHLRPVFATRRALVYVLPDVKSIAEVFGARGLTVSRLDQARDDRPLAQHSHQ